MQDRAIGLTWETDELLSTLLSSSIFAGLLSALCYSQLTSM